jgi:hypothetical protein
MTRRKRLVVLARLVALLALVGATVLVLCPVPGARITRRNYDRIRIRVSQVEVEDIQPGRGRYPVLGADSGLDGTTVIGIDAVRPDAGASAGRRPLVTGPSRFTKNLCPSRTSRRTDSVRLDLSAVCPDTFNLAPCWDR